MMRLRGLSIFDYITISKVAGQWVLFSFYYNTISNVQVCILQTIDINNKLIWRTNWCQTLVRHQLVLWARRCNYPAMIQTNCFQINCFLIYCFLIHCFLFTPFSNQLLLFSSNSMDILPCSMSVIKMGYLEGRVYWN